MNHKFKAMKNKIFIISLLIYQWFFSQKDTTINIPQATDSVEVFDMLNTSKTIVNDTNIFKIPEINNQTETFDDSLFISPSGKKDDSTIVRVSKENYIEVDTNNKKNIRCHFFKNDDGEVAGYDSRKTPFFRIYKLFYANGNIKHKGISCLFGFRLGIWYYYNEDGTLQYEKNWEERFDFTAEDLFDYCRKNGISLEQKFDGFQTRISRSSEPKSEYNNEKIWIIVFPDLKNITEIALTLSGNDGKVLNRIERRLALE